MYISEKITIHEISSEQLVLTATNIANIVF